MFVFLQNLLTKTAEKALMKSSKEANDRSAPLSFIAVRIGAHGIWRLSLTEWRNQKNRDEKKEKHGESNFTTLDVSP